MPFCVRSDKLKKKSNLPLREFHTQPTPSIVSLLQPSIMGTCMSPNSSPKNSINDNYTNITKQRFKIDISLFQDKTNNDCNGMSNVNDDFDQLCIGLKRIITAHTFYQSLEVKTNDTKKDIFLNFINEYYSDMVLNDYKHLVDDHSDNIYEINQIISKTTSCDVYQCQYSKRHYNRDRIERKETEPTEHDNNICEQDTDLIFYQTLFDGVHYYLIHLFHAGLRQIPRQYAMNQYTINDGQHDDDYKSNMYLDGEFQRLRDYVDEKKHVTDSFDRYAPSTNKFTINISHQEENENKSSSTTYMDQVEKHLFEYQQQKMIDINLINSLIVFLKEEMFDTDSIKMDLDSVNDHEFDGNINTDTFGLEIPKLIRSFIKTQES